MCCFETITHCADVSFMYRCIHKTLEILLLLTRSLGLNDVLHFSVLVLFLFPYILYSKLYMMLIINGQHLYKHTPHMSLATRLRSLILYLGGEKEKFKWKGAEEIHGKKIKNLELDGNMGVPQNLSYPEHKALMFWIPGARNICVPPPNAFVEILMSSEMVLGDGAFGKCLSHESGALANEISALIKETPRSSLAPSAMWGYSENSVTLKRAPSSWTSSLQIYKKKFCYL